jgi:imidazolonepropionase-like amidohydrolase
VIDEGVCDSIYLHKKLWTDDIEDISQGRRLVMPLSKNFRRSPVFFSVLLSFAFLHGAGLFPTSAIAQESGRPLAIRNVRIFDGSRVLAEDTVIVRNGKIAEIGKRLSLPADAQVIDGDGETLLPGLIDAHTHVFGEALKQALIFGVTTELDMFTDYRMAAEVRKQQAAGKSLDAADLFSAGTLVTAPKGHGTEYGISIPTINGPDEAQAFVDARIAEGSDYIKIIYDDGSTYGLHIPTISKATMAAVVAAAHRRGKLAVVHIGSLQDARDAIDAGADGLAHLFVDRAPDEDFGKFVAAHHAFVVATLTVLESVSGVASGASLITDPNLGPYISRADAANLSKSFPVRTGVKPSYAFAEEAVRQVKAARVPLLAGTDAPNPGTAHGASLHRELELLVNAGLTPIEALAAATSLPAEQFHLKDRGRIAVGLRADLLLVKGDPTTDIKATRNIIGVWKLGVPADRMAYLAVIKKEKSAVEQERQSPAPAGSEFGMVSDFEEKPTAKFGFGWTVSTDSVMGGKSTAEYKVVPDGAHGSKGSLLITGEITQDFAYPWAGAMFFPGAAPMQPVNLASKKEITFWAKGDGKTYRIMLFAKSGGMIPPTQSFIAGPEWKEYRFSLSQFNGMDGHDLMGLLFAGGPASGKFAFQIDDVRFQ